MLGRRGGRARAKRARAKGATKTKQDDKAVESINRVQCPLSVDTAVVALCDSPPSKVSPHLSSRRCSARSARPPRSHSPRRLSFSSSAPTTKPYQTIEPYEPESPIALWAAMLNGTSSLLVISPLLFSPSQTLSDVFSSLFFYSVVPALPSLSISTAKSFKHSNRHL
jgi:hypothetical protein